MTEKDPRPVRDLADTIQGEIFSNEIRQAPYLPGPVNRQSGIPLYETEAREAADRQALEGVRRGLAAEMPHNIANHNKNLNGAPGVEGLTGFYKGVYRDKGVPRPPKKK